MKCFGCRTMSPQKQSQTPQRQNTSNLLAHAITPSRKPKQVIHCGHKTNSKVKAISTNMDPFQDEGSFDVAPGTETAQAEAEVIVRPGDSLPGVALKYNISLATLRSANKLWTHDTIHLRQVLYIPIQAVAANKAKHTHSSSRARPEHLSHSLHSTSEIHTRAIPRIHSSSSDWNVSVDSETAAAHTISPGSPSTIKRIPLSELSFFPPSSISTLSSPRHTQLRTQNQSPPLRSKFDGADMSSSSFPHLSIRGPPRFGLANFWAGAKDEIISRLSFDSTRGSSDASEEHDFELDVVRPYGKLPHRYSYSTAEGNREQDMIPHSNGTAIPVHSVTEQDSVFLSNPGKSNVVRTVQLQPSPKMVIPASN
ncbi:hypothetical protein JB92DRAFT_2167578 [Gautieria morchelliformis]|nr:hypothetical protein JB92DRAFT_2167578 [Gautieria morchelliformis]